MGLSGMWLMKLLRSFKLLKIGSFLKH